MPKMGMTDMHATTILCVRKNNQVVIAGDGQVTMGQTVVKSTARKIRRLGDGGQVIAGFAGSTADAFTLFERFESKLKDHRANLTRAAVELAKDWRTDRMLRRLEALLIVADKTCTYLLGGNGDVVEPDEGILAIGSGGNYALSAARALYRHSAYSAKEIAQYSMQIAAEICVYTNQNIIYEEL